jgi:twitching motility protein PilT
MERFCKEKSGLLLIAGTTGSGKTTTVASMVDFINKNYERVIIAIEDPIEYIHVSQKSVIKQRELGSDTCLYSEALKRSLRQDPDVIVVGELLDKECVTAAIRAAEAGHLVISTIHAPDSAQAIERVIHFFPPEHAPSICQQLSTSLIGIVFQVLVPSKTAGRVLATEVLIATTAIKNLIREGKFYQLLMSIQTGREFGMYTLESRLKDLYDKGIIDYGTLQEYTKPNKR